PSDRQAGERAAQDGPPFSFTTNVATALAGNFSNLGYLDSVAINSAFHFDVQTLFRLGVLNNFCGAGITGVVELIELVFGVNGIAALFAGLHRRATCRMRLDPRLVFGLVRRRT